MTEIRIGVMRMKKRAAIVLGVSAVLLLVCILVPFGVLGAEQNETVGIIGGADGPTVIMIVGAFWEGVFPALITLSLSTVLCGLFCLLFSKAVKEHCTLKTSGIALSLSACASLLFYCFLLFASCFIMTSPDKHPVTLPLSVVVGGVAAVAFVWLFTLWVKFRAQKPSAKGVVFDILLFFDYLLPMFLLFDFIRNLIA